MTAGQLIGVGLFFLSLMVMIRVFNNVLKWIVSWHKGKAPDDSGATFCCGCFIYVILFAVMYLGVRWAGVL